MQRTNVGPEVTETGMALDGSTAESKLSSCVSPLCAGSDGAGAHIVRPATRQRHADVEPMLDAAVFIRPAGLRDLIRLPILNAADDHIIEPDRDFLHRHPGYDPAADQQVVAVVDKTGSDGGSISIRMGGRGVTSRPGHFTARHPSPGDNRCTVENSSKS
jgi:hypothetical protein